MNGIDEQLRALEEKLLNPDFRRNAEAVDALLAEDFCEFGSSGKVYDKTQTIAALLNEPPARVTLAEFRVHTHNQGIALVTYKAIGHSGDSSLRSSLWVLRDGRWQIAFHQGTNRFVGSQ